MHTVLIALMDRATVMVVWGIIAHLVADWLLQNDWMARNKATPGHLAAFTHTLIQGLLLGLVFPLPASLFLMFTHYYIDLRWPMQLWRKLYRQTTEGPVALHVAIWGDQVAHIAMIALVALIVAYLGG